MRTSFYCHIFSKPSLLQAQGQSVIGTHPYPHWAEPAFLTLLRRQPPVLEQGNLLRTGTSLMSDNNGNNQINLTIAVCTTFTAVFANTLQWFTLAEDPVVLWNDLGWTAFSGQAVRRLLGHRHCRTANVLYILQELQWSNKETKQNKLFIQA